MQLGMIGLGRMGANMVRRLMAGGHACVVWNRSEEPVRRLVREGATGAVTPGDTLIVTIAKEEPYLHLGMRPVTLERLLSELKASTARNPHLSLSIRADAGAPFGEVVKVMDAAKEAGINMVNAFTKNPAQK